MKFGLNIGNQQQDNNDLHYIDYNLLKRRIKDVAASLDDGELSNALTSNTTFESELAAEIGKVNTCFEIRQQNLLEKIAQLSEELAQKVGGAPIIQTLAGEDVAAGDLQKVHERQQHAAFHRLVELLQEMDRLRKYAVWNAVAIVKILKKRRKQTRFGIEDSSVERAGWLSRQCFFSGSEFAELHVALESLGHAVVFSELGRGSEIEMVKTNPQQCPICLETISDVVELSCKHHFCWKCFVLGPIAFQPGEYRMTQCPICRQDATISTERMQQDNMQVSSIMPSSEGTLSRFLHTYFASATGRVQDVMPQNSDPSNHDVMDVIGKLVNVVVADSTWQRSGQAGTASEAPERASGSTSDLAPGPEGFLSSCNATGTVPFPSDFFQTLPPKPMHDDKAQMERAQKLQWLQIASTNDPLAVEASMYCPLCSEPLLMEAVVTTPCKHHIHQVCIRRLELPVCPLCPTELPFSWFLPNEHPLCHRGFRVVRACEYKPRFPGGPDRKCSGYPLHQPPPARLLGPGGISVRSYLHRVPPIGANEDDDDDESSPPPAPTLAPEVADDASESSASDSSSDDSNSKCSEDEDVLPFSPPPAGSYTRKKKEATWAYTPLGKMRLVPQDSQESKTMGLSLSSPPETMGVTSFTSDCEDVSAHSKILLIGEHL